MMSRMQGGLLCLALLAWPAFGQDRPYKDGPVIVVTAVKLVDGQYENYMSYLAANWRPVMEAAKTGGIVTEYHVYGAQAHNPNEADLYLVTTYPNMAAFDGLQEKMDPITSKVTRMNYRQAEEASGKRMVMRTILGEEMLRELVFK